MNHKELIERLRYGSLCPVSGDGCEDKLKAADAIESLLAENERFKYERDLAVQKMKDGWVRICNSGIQYYVVENAKLQAELAKYRDAPVVASAAVSNSSDTFIPIIKFDYGVELRMAVPASGKPIALIVKPGE